ncbi:flagellar filament capping protein FliD [Actinoplanes sp. NPDC051346]|uniref:flagellar filament capping protein FliD n=1 Tax=Actinoplanes sp. NPDC051346 TaxID=3155048 RepID=UPI0034210098
MASVDGLVTGMSTSSTVAQLMQVEALPQTALKNKVTAENKAVTGLQAVNAKMSALITATKALSEPGSWTGVKATSSSDAAVVTALPGAQPGSFSFAVESLATTHTATFTGGSVSSASDAALAPVLDNGVTFDIRLADGSTKTLTPTNGSLNSVAAAINGEADSMFKAAAVQVAPGQYTLQLTAKSSGAAAAFSNDVDGDWTNDLSGALTGLSVALGTPNLTAQGVDAQLRVGTDSPTETSYVITSASNTFTEVQTGLTVTATKKTDPGAPVTISLASDPEDLATKVATMVEAANVALSEIATQMKAKSGTTAGGALVGESALRKLSQDILSTVSGGAPNLGPNNTVGTFNSVGITVDRGGKLKFDKAEFLKSYTADPVKTQAYFDSHKEVAHPKASATKFDPGWDQAQGIALKLLTVGLQASEGVKLPTDPANKLPEGTLPGLVKRRNAAIKTLNNQVSAWDVRLDLRKAALEKQFSSLETAMGKMQQQSSWLASQLAGLG